MLVVDLKMRSSKRVVQKEEADLYVLPFEVSNFRVQLSEPAKGFISMQPSQSSNFQISPLVAQQTGIAQVQQQAQQAEIERLAIEKVREVQEQAYHEAYQLGLQEGRERAFQEAQLVLTAQIDSFAHVLEQIENLKLSLVEYNEGQIAKLVFYMATRLARKAVNEDQSLVLQLIKETVKSTQQDENVEVSLSASDFDFVEQVRGQLGRDFEFLKRVQLVRTEDIASGGVRIQTNYGSIDATLETQIQKMWERLIENVVPIRDKIGA